MNSTELRKQHPQFIYEGYTWKLEKRGLSISFSFSVPPDIQFHPTLLIEGVTEDHLKRVGEETLENFIFHLGLIETLSYWKAACSPEIVVQTGYLSKDQIRWWKQLILKGMGEYFYQNKINFTQPNFLTITSLPISSKPGSGDIPLPKPGLSTKVLVPIGGGKDAIVTLETLKRANVNVLPFVLNPKPEQENILKAAKEKNAVIVRRSIDPKLLELNRKGYINGHTPFSAYLAFLSVFCAALFDCGFVALSNERSSNEGNRKYRGKEINHQYSKSFDFEKRFRAYAKAYLAKNVEYFSFLRPLYELQIAKLFAQYPKYFPVFLSCNEAYKTASGKRKTAGTWCGKCPKCLFVFLALYPFLGEQQTVGIFKKNLLKDKKLRPLLDEILGKKRFKPFECVGTIAESRVALSLCKGEIMNHPLLGAWNTKHFLPPQFEKILRELVG